MGGERLGKNVQTPKPPPIPLCDTCQLTIEKYGTNEYVSSWLCTCETNISTAVFSSRQKTLSKGFGMYVEKRLTPLRYRYNKYHTPFWRSK